MALRATELEDLRDQASRIKWHHAFEVVPGFATTGTYQPGGLWKRLRLDKRLQGQTLLDIGARDGYFTLQAAKAGAEVTAVDSEAMDKMGFGVTMRANKLDVKFIESNLYDLPKLGLAPFDVVLCLGVLYHVPNPFLALQILRTLTLEGGKLFLESTNLAAGVETSFGHFDLPKDMHDLPISMYVRRNVTSFWDMTPACIRAMLEDVGFKPDRIETWGKRVLFEATASGLPNAH